MKVDLIECRNGAKKQHENCTIARDRQIPSLRFKVNEVLKNLITKIGSNNNTWSDAEAYEVAKYINNTSVPVLRMAVSDVFMQTQYLTQPAVVDVIATDFAIAILNSNERDLRQALGYLNKVDEDAEKKLDKIFDNLRELRTSLGTARQNALKLVSDQQNFLEKMKKYHDQWGASFPQLENTLNFAENNTIR